MLSIEQFLNRKYWMNNIKKWMHLPMPELLMMASSRKRNGSSLLDCPSCPTEDPIGQRTDLNCTWLWWNCYANEEKFHFLLAALKDEVCSVLWREGILFFFFHVILYIMYLQQEEKLETELTAWVLKKRSKTHKNLKQNALIRQNKTEHKFSRESSSSGHAHYRNRQMTYALPVGFFQPHGRCAWDEPDWQQISQVICLFR